LNREGVVVFFAGLFVSLPTYAAATSVMGPDSLRAKGLAWVVCGTIWVLADAAAIVHKRKPVKQFAWLARWSGGMTGLSISFLGIIALVGGISYLIGPDSL
jgi:hypothetical protein